MPGIGAEVAMQVIEQAFDWLDAPLARVHGVDVPVAVCGELGKAGVASGVLGG